MRTRRRAAGWAVLLGLPVLFGALVPAPLGFAAVGATTVAAPGGGQNANVSVSRTTQLNNQSVEVSWSGFRPSSSDVLANGTGSYDTTTDNPVRVYECRGSNPDASSECYGSPGFGGIAPSGSDP